MDELDKFKEFVNFCKDNKVLNAKNGDMEVSLMYEPKMIDFGDEKDDNNGEEEINDILFHSINR